MRGISGGSSRWRADPHQIFSGRREEGGSSDRADTMELPQLQPAAATEASHTVQGAAALWLHHLHRDHLLPSTSWSWLLPASCSNPAGQHRHHLHWCILAVSPEEFALLLEMMYTGKLPVGKHNFSKIISLADSLQMSRRAVSCKNLLASLKETALSRVR